MGTLSNAFLYQDGDASPITTSLGTVTERLISILGMTRTDFFNTYFTGQKELKVMAAMTGPEKAQFLSRVLGYEKLKEAQDRLRERRGTLKTQLQTLESTLQDTEELEAQETAVTARIKAARTRERRGSAGAFTRRWRRFSGARVCRSGCAWPARKRGWTRARGNTWTASVPRPGPSRRRSARRSRPGPAPRWWPRRWRRATAKPWCGWMRTASRSSRIGWAIFWRACCGTGSVWSARAALPSGPLHASAQVLSS